MISSVILLAALAALASGGRSPNADVIEDFKKTSLGSKYSRDILEDALLDVPGLISKNGYPVETHTVTTSDGYILDMHRIPHGKDSKNEPGQKPVVFLMHGLLFSSADYIILGSGNALGYLLAEQGYDVWIGNARGNFYSRKHVSLNPDTDKSYWRFSWDEIGLYDIPACVDYILELTGESQVHYVGHSQGGTVFLVLNSMKPEYNQKFKSFQGLAPASYFTNNDNSLYGTVAKYEMVIEIGALVAGIGEVLHNKQAQALLSSYVCDGAPMFDPLCIDAIMSNRSLSTLNATMLPLFLAHAPAGASIRQFIHYAQVMRRDSFARYNHNVVTNLLLYGSINPPEYEVSKVTVPSFLYYGMADAEVHWRDLYKLANNLGNTIQTYRVGRENFNHYDFLWASDVTAMLHNTIIKNLKTLD